MSNYRDIYQIKIHINGRISKCELGYNFSSFLYGFAFYPKILSIYIKVLIKENKSSELDQLSNHFQPSYFIVIAFIGLIGLFQLILSLLIRQLVAHYALFGEKPFNHILTHFTHKNNLILEYSSM